MFFSAASSAAAMTLFKSLVQLAVVFSALDVCAVSLGVAFGGFALESAALDLLRQQVSNWFGIHGEGNLFAWYSSAKLLLAGMLLLAIFIAKGSMTAMLGALVCALMSADEGGQIHENLGLRFSVALLQPNQTLLGSSTVHDWPYLVGPLGFLIVGVFFYVIYREKAFSKRAGFLISIGIAVLLAGAVGAEILSHIVKINESWYRLDLAEEFLELAGSSVMILGCALAYKEQIEPTVSQRALAVLRIATVFLIPLAAMAFIAALWVFLGIGALI